MPCVPIAGIQNGMFALAHHRLRRLGRVRAGQSRLSHLGRLLLGKCGGSAGARPRDAAAGARHHPADALAERAHHISDLPGPTGGIMLKSTTGAMLIVNDTGIYIQNGKGAMITLIGPTVAINNGALTVI